MIENLNTVVGDPMPDPTTTDAEPEELKMEVEEDTTFPANATVVNCLMLNVRAMPSKKSEVRTVVSVGTNLEVLARTGEWYRVKTPDGTFGFVMSEFMED